MRSLCFLKSVFRYRQQIRNRYIKKVTFYLRQTAFLMTFNLLCFPKIKSIL